MNGLELLFCYWVISFLIIFFLYTDSDAYAGVEVLGIKHFIKIILISMFLGWILVPIKTIIELVNLAKNI